MEKILSVKIVCLQDASPVIEFTCVEDGSDQPVYYTFDAENFMQSMQHFYFDPNILDSIKAIMQELKLFSAKDTKKGKV